MVAPDARELLIQKVFDLRVAGHKPSQIARLLVIPVDQVLAAIRVIGDRFLAENSDLIRDAYIIASHRYEQLYQLVWTGIQDGVAAWQRGDKPFPVELVKLAITTQQSQDKLLGLTGKTPIAPATPDELPDLVKQAENAGIRLPPLDALPPRVTTPCPPSNTTRA